jgi:ribosomal protein S18 acetylase RimI-like enzyme
VIYKNNLDSVTPEMLKGFFVDWPNPPSPEIHLKLLKSSNKVVIAIDPNKNQIAGFITAISDGVLSAYIPFLEVLPEYQHKGIGRNLVNHMVKELDDIYMIDLSCDDDLVPFYENLGMLRTNGMMKRNYKMQSGK